jgi:hypothetical protein
VRLRRLPRAGHVVIIRGYCLSCNRLRRHIHVSFGRWLYDCPWGVCTACREFERGNHAAWPPPETHTVDDTDVL